MSTLEINDLAESYITNELHARPASKGQYGFKFVLNTSKNQVVCHGVPSAQWEHTIAVTSDGYEVLTLREEELNSLT